MLPTNKLPDSIVVHPLVLLSVVDHFKRVGTNKRVVGVILGETRKGRVDATNSFAGEEIYTDILALTASSLALSFSASEIIDSKCPGSDL